MEAFHLDAPTLPSVATPFIVPSSRSRDLYDDKSYLGRKVDYSTPVVESQYNAWTGCGGRFFPNPNLFDGRSEARNEREFNRIWTRLQQSEAFQKYRNKQPKNEKQRIQRWPEDLEIAFFKALVKYEPMGRRKLLLRGKLQGRNELLAYEIERLTGTRLTDDNENKARKRVSSHIQVVKGILQVEAHLEGISEILRYFANPDAKKESRARRERLASPSSSYHRYQQAPGDRSSYYAAPSTNPTWGRDANVTRSQATRLCQTWDGELIPASFKMNIIDVENSPDAVLHDYTDLDAGTGMRPPITLERLGSMTKLPENITMLLAKSRHRPKVIFMDASFECHVDHLPPQSEIRIQEDFRATSSLTNFEQIECTTRFLRDGREIESHTLTQAVKEYDQNTGKLCGVPFGSSFWAIHFVKYAQRLRQAQARRVDSVIDKTAQDQPWSSEIKAEEDVMPLEEEVRRHINSTSAIQEIRARPKHLPGHIERLLIVIWQFRQAAPGTQGQTTWCDVLLPETGDEIRIGHNVDFNHNIPYNIEELKPELMCEDPSFASARLPSQYDFDDSQLRGFELEPTTYELDTLSAVAMAGPRTLRSPAEGNTSDLPDSHGNTVDFTGGHIDIAVGEVIDTYPFAHPVDPRIDQQQFTQTQANGSYSATHTPGSSPNESEHSLVDLSQHMAHDILPPRSFIDTSVSMNAASFSTTATDAEISPSYIDPTIGATTSSGSLHHEPRVLDAEAEGTFDRGWTGLYEPMYEDADFGYAEEADGCVRVDHFAQCEGDSQGTYTHASDEQVCGGDEGFVLVSQGEHELCTQTHAILDEDPLVDSQGIVVGTDYGWTEIQASFER